MTKPTAPLDPPATAPASDATGRPAANRSRIRAFAARHPVAAYLLISFTLSWAILFPLTLNGLPPEPGLIAVVLFAMLGGATLVTAAESGRAGVRELLSRTFRWRVHPVWYLAAVLALPLVIVLGAVIVRGQAAIDVLTGDSSLYVTYLLGFAIVPLINLWEETGWMGFVQARLEAQHGPLAAAAVTGVLFGTFHVPLYVEAGSVLSVLGTTMLVIFAIAVPIRIVFGWLYHRSGASVLIVAIAHAGFNAGNDGPLTLALWPDAWPTSVAPAVVIGFATAILLVTRGRLIAGSTVR